MKLTLPPLKLLHHTNYLPSSSSSSSSSSKLQSILTTLPSIKPTTTMTSSPTTPTLTLRCRPRRLPYRTTTTNTTTSLLVILGATGAGKSRLSIDLATRFLPSEIINSDKIQLYRGLDITTNKIPPRDRAGIPHHLLGTFPDTSADVSRTQFRRAASAAISQISSRHHLPVLVGGSNSLVHALLARRFDPRRPDPFEGEDCGVVATRYECCFLWVDVEAEVLDEYLRKRVDEMVESGMVEELAEYYGSGEVDGCRPGVGLRKAIGVPEFERYFRGGGGERWKEEGVRGEVFERAVEEIKENTCRLARRQVEKIRRMRRMGWDVRRLDATEAVKGAIADERKEWVREWERGVVDPAVKIVKRFLPRRRAASSE